MAATIDGALFKEIMAEMREHSLKRLTSPHAVAESEEENHLGDYVPSQRLHEDYSRLRSVPLPVSNDDELDDAIQQIKAIGNSGATKTANNSQTGIKVATNAFESDQNASEFENKMGSTRGSAHSDLADAINATYDKAVELAQNLSPSQANAICSLMENNLGPAFNEIWDQISSFIVDAVRNVGKFTQEAPSNIDDFFAGIAYCIKENF